MHASFQAPPSRVPHCRRPDTRVCLPAALLLPLPPTCPRFQVSFPARRNPGERVSYYGSRVGRGHGGTWSRVGSQMCPRDVSLIRPPIMPERRVRRRRAAGPSAGLSELAPQLCREPPWAPAARVHSPQLQNTTLTTYSIKPRGTCWSVACWCLVPTA